jgi:hypothetical protein
MITTDNWFNAQTGQCKKYQLSVEGLNKIKALAGLEQFVPELSSDLSHQLESGEFEYTAKSDRIYNPIQQISKQTRGTLLANRGYRYNYDIEAAAPTLLLQRAQQIDHTQTFTALQHYVSNRSQVRSELAQQCEISQDKIKFVINAMLQGAVISCYQHGKIFQELDCDYNAIKKLQNNATVSALKTDIKLLWSILRRDLPEKHITLASGKTRRARLNGKDKSGYYRVIENQVGKVIQKTLRKQHIKFLWIHDGWCCDGIIDPREVETQVRRATGYTVKIDYEVFGDE